MLRMQRYRQAARARRYPHPCLHYPTCLLCLLMLPGRQRQVGPGLLTASIHCVSDCDIEHGRWTKQCGDKPQKGCWKWGAQVQRRRSSSSASDTYHSLQSSHEQPIQYLSRLVTVSHILEGFRGVLTAYIKEHFLSTAVIDCQPIFS